MSGQRDKVYQNQLSTETFVFYRELLNTVVDDDNK